VLSGRRPRFRSTPFLATAAGAIAIAVVSRSASGVPAPHDLGADDLRSLLRYLARRQRARERLQLGSFVLNGNVGSYGHFEFAVLREANDLARTRYEGKRAALCGNGPPRIAAWATGRESG
jgi:hypothetical protein